jgi:hypothetical protein
MPALQTSPHPAPLALAVHPQSSALTPQSTSGRSGSGSSSAWVPHAAAAARAGAAAARHPPHAAGVGTPLGHLPPAARCRMRPPSTAAAGVTGHCRVVAPCAAAAPAGQLALGPLRAPVLAGSTALAAAAGAAPTTTAAAVTWAGLGVPPGSCSSGQAAAPAAGTSWGQSMALVLLGVAVEAAVGNGRTGYQTETHWHQVRGCPCRYSNPGHSATLCTAGKL